VKDAAGALTWTGRADIQNQITLNTTWARTRGLTVPAGELVTGEHSGLFVLPQQPVDNPQLASALSLSGVRYVAADASRDPQQRAIGSAVTVPRHPMNLFFNVATVEEEIDEYNWLYSAAGPEGSGVCEQNPETMTCIDPLTVDQFASYLVPLEATIALRHATSNDPRPTFVHQSNLTEDRLLYPVLERVLATYRSVYADSTPLESPTMTQAGDALRRQAAWKNAQTRVEAYTLDGVLRVRSTSGAIEVPVTAPTGAVNATWGTAYGTAYAGERSAWNRLTTATALTLRLAT
jgi:hypothetical protein